MKRCTSPKQGKYLTIISVESYILHFLPHLVAELTHRRQLYNYTVYRRRFVFIVPVTSHDRNFHCTNHSAGLSIKTDQEAIINILLRRIPVCNKASLCNDHFDVRRIDKAVKLVSFLWTCSWHFLMLTNSSWSRWGSRFLQKKSALN